MRINANQIATIFRPHWGEDQFCQPGSRLLWGRQNREQSLNIIIWLMSINLIRPNSHNSSHGMAFCWFICLFYRSKCQMHWISSILPFHSLCFFWESIVYFVFHQYLASSPFQRPLLYSWFDSSCWSKKINSTFGYGTHLEMEVFR